MNVIDHHQHEMCADLLQMFDEQDRADWLKQYIDELCARWGRWALRKRAPALCFEAACVGGLALLQRMGRLPSEKTARVDALLAGVVAGVVVDAVEPLARSQGHQVRAKAIEIVANEFLNRAAGMSSAHPHRKNHNNQMSRINEAAVSGSPNARKVSSDSQKSTSLRKISDSASSPSSNYVTMHPQNNQPSRKMSNDNHASNRKASIDVNRTGPPPITSSGRNRLDSSSSSGSKTSLSTSLGNRKPSIDNSRMARKASADITGSVEERKLKNSDRVYTRRPSIGARKLSGGESYSNNQSRWGNSSNSSSRSRKYSDADVPSRIVKPGGDEFFGNYQHPSQSRPRNHSSEDFISRPPLIGILETKLSGSDDLTSAQSQRRERNYSAEDFTQSSSANYSNYASANYNQAYSANYNQPPRAIYNPIPSANYNQQSSAFHYHSSISNSNHSPNPSYNQSYISNHKQSSSSSYNQSSFHTRSIPASQSFIVDRSPNIGESFSDNQRARKYSNEDLKPPIVKTRRKVSLEDIDSIDCKSRNSPQYQSRKYGPSSPAPTANQVSPGPASLQTQYSVEFIDAFSRLGTGDSEFGFVKLDEEFEDTGTEPTKNSANGL